MSPERVRLTHLRNRQAIIYIANDMQHNVFTNNLTALKPTSLFPQKVKDRNGTK